MKKLLAMALCLVAVSGYAQKGKEKIAADFYGVDYSCVDVKGADEEPGAFIKAFEAINRLFLSEPKKYDVAGFTGIDILSTGVEQANESLGALAAEQFTPRSAATDCRRSSPATTTVRATRGWCWSPRRSTRATVWATTPQCCSIPRRTR
jgi:hypothetical protein